MRGRSKRLLILVPIIHTEVDLGSLQEAVRRRHLERTGTEQWDQRQAAVKDLWRNIRSQIEALHLDYSRVRLYQDGLPVCGREDAIVRDLALKASINHQILVDLMAKGATLTGTEVPELVVKEYELARKAFASMKSPRKTGPGLNDARESRKLLDERDTYIARRIDQTLMDGETGLIFLGMLHSLDNHLPPDIRLARLDDLADRGGCDGVVPSKDT
jgi:hypothetical protein